MYFITQEQWNKIPDSYKMERDPEHGGKACFLCFLTGDGTGGDTLCLEHEHFEIVPDSEYYNSMCLNCRHLNAACYGTTSKVWTGCILKDRTPEQVTEYIDHMSETLKGAEK